MVDKCSLEENIGEYRAQFDACDWLNDLVIRVRMVLEFIEEPDAIVFQDGSRGHPDLPFEVYLIEKRVPIRVPNGSAPRQHRGIKPFDFVVAAVTSPNVLRELDFDPLAGDRFRW